MTTTKQDYKKGLLFFCGIAICILSFVTTPDGESLFHKLIGLIGIGPGIHIGDDVTLYIFMLIPIAAGIWFGKKVFKYWRGYGERFKELSILLRSLPVTILVAIFIATSAINPSVVDRIYFFVISRQQGLRSITVSAPHTLAYEYSGDYRTYSYTIWLNNHGSEAQEFSVKLLYEDLDGRHKVMVRDEDGDIKIFTLMPGQPSSFSGEFAVPRDIWDSWRSFNGFFSAVILVSDDEQHRPDLLVRRPLF